MEWMLFFFFEGNSDSDVETLNKPKKGGCVVLCNPTLAGSPILLALKGLCILRGSGQVSPAIRTCWASQDGACTVRQKGGERPGPRKKRLHAGPDLFRCHGFWCFLRGPASFAFSQSCVRPEAKGRTTCLTLGNSEPRAETKAPASPTLKRVEASTVISRASVPKGEQPVSHPRARRRTVASWGSSNNAKKTSGDRQFRL